MAAPLLRRAGVFAICAIVFATAPAHAAVTFYATQAAFAAVSATTVQSTFESLTGGVNTASPIVQGSVTYASTLNALPFYVLKPGNPGDACCTFPHVTSAMLAGNGDEDWDMTFAGSPPHAVGFNYTSNNTGITVSVFDVSDSPIGSTTISAHNTAGYLGITSTTGMGRIHVFSDNLAPPNAQNSAIDNVAVGDLGPTPSLSGTWGRLKVIYR